MNLNEAKEILKKAGFIYEDTDEYDDADLGLDVDPTEYHRQKAKMTSLSDWDDSAYDVFRKPTQYKIGDSAAVCKIQLLRNVIRKNFWLFLIHLRHRMISSRNARRFMTNTMTCMVNWMTRSLTWKMTARRFLKFWNIRKISMMLWATLLANGTSETGQVTWCLSATIWDSPDR